MADGALDEAVRRADPDRWLASRFIVDPAARADVIAVWAYDHELSRAVRVASTPLIAEIRLAWWREALDKIFAEAPVRAHPTARALADAVRRRALPRAPLEAMIDGRIAVLETPRLDLEAAVAWADAVAGSAAELAARVLDPEASLEAAGIAGRVWGLVLLARAGAVEGPAAHAALEDALAAAARAVRGLRPEVFPAVVCATLARGALAGRPSTPLGKRVRLTWAIARGRL